MLPAYAPLSAACNDHSCEMNPHARSCCASAMRQRGQCSPTALCLAQHESSPPKPPPRPAITHFTAEAAGARSLNSSGYPAVLMSRLPTVSAARCSGPRPTSANVPEQGGAPKLCVTRGHTRNILLRWSPIFRQRPVGKPRETSCESELCAPAAHVGCIRGAHGTPTLGVSSDVAPQSIGRALWRVDPFNLSTSRVWSWQSAQPARHPCCHADSLGSI